MDVAQWADKGDARADLMNSSPELALSSILVGMGSLSYGELAGERMKLGLILHDPEEEHDCFSDNTHNSHFYDALGVRNVYTGAYKRIDGGVLEGPSLSELVALVDSSQMPLCAKTSKTLCAKCRHWSIRLTVAKRMTS